MHRGGAGRGPEGCVPFGVCRSVEPGAGQRQRDDTLQVSSRRGCDVDRGSAQGIPAGEPGRGGCGTRSGDRIREMARTGAAGRDPRAARDDAGHRVRRRRAIGADRPAPGIRRQRLHLLHRLSQPEGPRAGRQSPRGAGVPLARPRAAGPDLGNGAEGDAGRNRTPTSTRVRAAARSARGHRTRARCWPAASRWKRRCAR